MTLDERLRELSVSIDPEKTARLREYAALLEKWGRRVNLTALRGDALVRRLIVEPLWVAGRLRPRGTYWDIGSGSGSPAIPWCIVHSFDNVHLLEPRVRRAAFLRHAVHRLGLRGVAVHTARLEACAPGPAADWITIQGVHPTPSLLADLARKSGPQTRVVWLTGDTESMAYPNERLDVPGSARRAIIFSASDLS